MAGAGKQRQKKNGKTVRKKFDKQKVYLRTVDRVKRHLVMCYVSGKRYCEMFDVSGAEPRLFLPGRRIAKMLTETAHQWTIYIAALGVDNNDNKYHKGEELVLPYRCYQQQLAEALNTHHQEFLKRGMNKNHLIAAGWIASPEGMEISEDLADKIFYAMGGWDNVEQ